MPRLVYFNPSTRKFYYTTLVGDPNVPAGYLPTQTSDGSNQFADGIRDQNLQVFMTGQFSGGYPAIPNPDPTSNPKYPNGRLS